MSRFKKIKGFTLIELVMVIIILGILASITLAKFVNFKTKAIENQEEAVISALRIAVQTVHMSYVALGLDSWPGAAGEISPFDLLAQAPPSRYALWYGADLTITPDNVTWRYRWAPEWTCWHIACPHWNGSLVFGVGATGTKGRRYNYCFGANYPQYGHLPTVHKPGDIWALDAPGH